MRRYKKYAAPYRSAFIIGPLMMLTEVVGEIMLPRLMSFIINRGVAQRGCGLYGADRAFDARGHGFYGGGRRSGRLFCGQGIDQLYERSASGCIFQGTAVFI